MSDRVLASGRVLAAMTMVVGLAPPFAAAQTAPAGNAAAAATWTMPRTSWGDPDLQGIYTNKDFSPQLGVPFERPREFGNRQLLTDAEYAERLKQAQRTLLDDTEGRGSGTNDLLRAPLFWHERGNPSRRTSLVIDPPDGRIPPLTAEARKRAEDEPNRPAFRESGATGRGTDSWLDRSVHERCITRGVPGSMIPSQYGNAYQILQTRDYVAIRYEMDHETRIIPLDGRPHVGPNIRQWIGDARGHWEGDTLVVETTNFNGNILFRRAAENLRVLERFTRVGPSTVNWEVILEDPTTWTRPWTFMVPLTSKVEEVLGGLQAASKIWVYEYECHEGNYGMRNLLSAARAEEKAAAEAARAGKK